MTDAQLFGIGLVKSLLWWNFVKNPRKLTKDCVKTQEAVFTKIKVCDKVIIDMQNFDVLFMQP